MSSSDDPAVIQAFLSCLHLNLNLSDERVPSLHSESETKEQSSSTDTLEQHESLKPSAGTITPRAVEEVPASTSSTPHAGTRPPPPTPETRGITAKEIEPLPPIDEGHDEASLLANASGMSTFVDSAFLCSDPKDLRPAVSPFSPNTLVNKVDRRHDPATESILELMQNESVACYQQRVLEKSREQALARLAVRQRESHGQAPQEAEFSAGSNEDLTHTPVISLSQEVDKPVSVSSMDQQELEGDKSLLAGTEPFPDLQNGSVVDSGTFQNDEPVGSDTSDTKSEVRIIVDAPSTPGSYKSATVDASPTQSPDKDGVSIKDVVDIQPLNVTDGGESRKDAVYFASWGKPSHREGPAACVRKVVLNNLPPAVDFTIVQSLIFGGAIEEMKIRQITDDITVAFVTFVNGEACDKYYDKLPNGLAFKYKGRAVTVFVERGHDVDVISGVMKNYLECGASRVVKIVGVDSDWSMRALHKIAAGDQGRRKIEAILDSYRNEIRTIVFRFTNISDAVSFRGAMLRSREWQEAEIQFAVDPCERATGIHFE